MEETLVEVDERNSYDKSSDETCIVVVLSSLVAVCGYYAFGNAVGYSSPAESGIVDDFSLTVTQYSFFASMLSIGAMLGALLSGKLADLIGRRKAMAVSDALCILGWLVIASARSPLWLYIGRFCVGCGIGLLSYMVPVYIAEITSKNVRGTFTSLSQLMLGCAQALLNVIGSFINWRTLALIGLIPSLIQVLLLLFIPESPRWLVKIGRVEQFEASLQRLRGKNADISQEAADIKAYTERLAQIQEEGILALFQWKYTYPVIVGVGLMVFQQFGGLNGFTFYTASIFESAGFPSSTGIIIAAVAQILMTVLGVVLIDKCGRRLLLLISVSGMCLGCILTGLSFFLEDLALETEISSGLVITGVVVMN